MVLYADIQNEIFKEFHSVLKKAAEDSAVRYILRYRPVTGYSLTRPLKDKPLFVAGYGVELMLKKTDYIVIDDREVETGIHSQSKIDIRSSRETSKAKSGRYIRRGNSSYHSLTYERTREIGLPGGPTHLILLIRSRHITTSISRLPISILQNRSR